MVLKCESCGGTIRLSGNQEYGFCQYCGTKIMLKNIVEFKGHVKFNGTPSHDEVLEDVVKYIKLNKYEKAEKLCELIVKDSPGNSQVYYELIVSMTHNFSKKDVIHEKVSEYAENMLLLAEDSMTASWEKLKKNIDNYIEVVNLEYQCTMLVKEIRFQENNKNSNMGAGTCIVLGLLGVMYMSNAIAIGTCMSVVLIMGGVIAFYRNRVVEEERIKSLKKNMDLLKSNKAKLSELETATQELRNYDIGKI